MTAGKKQNVTLDRSHAFHHAICARANLTGGFASGTAVTEKLPAGPIRKNVGRAPALILPVIPFEQVPIDFSHGPKASQLAGSRGPLQRAGKHLGEGHSTEPFLKPSRIALAAFSERQIGKSCVLARQAPGGLSVPGHVNYWECFAHRFTAR
jgi:hypothetical protein